MSSGQLPSTESCILQLAHAEATKTAGGSLARTLYTRPLTVLLHGELGSGKTTFFQGFAEALGVKTHVTSPTFAIEQRYETTGHGELLHLDLFRLNADEAKNILQQSEAHQGIRVVEWADRTQLPFSEPHIAIWLSESGSSRTLDCTFADMALPGREEILEWRTHMELPEHIAQHCDAVADFSTEFAEYFVKQSMFVRTVALHKAAEVHDLLRFMDFRPGAGPAGAVDEEHAVWEEV